MSEKGRNFASMQNNGKVANFPPRGAPHERRTEMGQKIDFIRIINVMYEQGRFKGKDGEKVTKKTVFTTIGKALNIDLSNYDKDLSRSLSDSTKLEKHTKVFEDMKQKMIDIWNSK